MNTNNDGLAGELARGTAKARVVRFRMPSLPAVLLAFFYVSASGVSALIFFAWLTT